MVPKEAQDRNATLGLLSFRGGYAELAIRSQIQAICDRIASST